jgi:hypothetical protein
MATGLIDFVEKGFIVLGGDPQRTAADDEVILCGETIVDGIIEKRLGSSRERANSGATIDLTVDSSATASRVIAEVGLTFQHQDTWFPVSAL